MALQMDGGEEARDYINKEPEKDKHGGCAIKQGYALQQFPSCWQEASSYRTEHQVTLDPQDRLFRKDYLKTAQGDC